MFYVPTPSSADDADGAQDHDTGQDVPGQDTGQRRDDSDQDQGDNEEEDMDQEEEDPSAVIFAKMSSAAATKSDTLKSAALSASDFNTPPESPSASPRGSSASPSSLHHHHSAAELICDPSKPPIPPPRVKKLAASKKLDKLKIGSSPSPVPISPLARSSSQGDEHHPRLQHQQNVRESSAGPISSQHHLKVGHQVKAVSSDAITMSSASHSSTTATATEQPPLRGHLSMLVVSAKGLRQMMKVRWFVHDRKLGRLRYYRSEDETEAALGEIDIQSATFCYDVQSDRNGEFTIW